MNTNIESLRMISNSWRIFFSWSADDHAIVSRRWKFYFLVNFEVNDANDFEVNHADDFEVIHMVHFKVNNYYFEVINGTSKKSLIKPSFSRQTAFKFELKKSFNGNLTISLGATLTVI